MSETISIAPAPEFQQDELQDEKPMSYTQYSRLLKLKFELNHQLHVCDPGEKPVLERNIKALQLRLSQAPDEYLHIYRRSTEKIG